MYNLTLDSLEIDNLVHHSTPALKQIRHLLAELLRDSPRRSDYTRPAERLPENLFVSEEQQAFLLNPDVGPSSRELRGKVWLGHHAHRKDVVE